VRATRYILAIGIATFFAVMWGSLLRERVQLGIGPTAVPKYEQLLGDDEQSRESTMGLYLGARRIGQTQTKVSRAPSGAIHIHSTTLIGVKDLPAYIFRTVGDIRLDFFAEISPLNGLRHLRVVCPRLDVKLIGQVRDGQLRVRGILGGEAVEVDTPYTSSPFIGEAFTPLSGLPDLSRARVGDNWNLHLVNPIVGTVQIVRVSIEERRTARHGDEETELLRLNFHSGTSVWKAWITQEGDVLVQGTPFGFTLRREDIPPHLAEAIRQ